MAGPLYLADPPELRRTVELDGLTALYHVPSGTTHLLAAPAPQILDVLGSGPASVPALLARMRKLFQLETGPGVLAALESRLNELEAAGLVRRA